MVATDESITVTASARQENVVCPVCCHHASRVHSRYERTVADLPWQGVAVRFLLRVRKFFCDNNDCLRRVFTEPLPAVVARYARKTARLTDALRELVYLVGGNAAARIAECFGLLVSSSTLLRHLEKKTTQSVQAQNEVFAAPTPHVLGIDDFAFKKGHRYGTILVDLEKRCPVDLLPDRDAKTVAKWLQEHPGVEIVSRDRAEVYRNGVNAGAPQAIQVADRWHLLKNVGNTLEKIILRKHRLLREAGKPPLTIKGSEESQTDAVPLQKASTPVFSTEPTTDLSLSSHTDRKRERYKEVVSLWKQGRSVSAISRATGRDRKTIRGWVSGDDLPPRRPRPERLGKVTPFADHLSQRFQEGCRTGVALFAEIKALGYTGGYTAVNTYLSKMRHGSLSDRSEAMASRVPSVRRLAWALTNRQSARITPEENAVMDRLCQSCPERYRRL